jgi:hypothetical protein
VSGKSKDRKDLKIRLPDCLIISPYLISKPRFAGFTILKSINRVTLLLGGIVLLMICNISSGADKFPITVDMSNFNPADVPGYSPSTREKIYLNGMWDFYPIIDKEHKYGPELEVLPPVPEDTEWKKFRVPARWNGILTKPAESYNIPKYWQNAKRAWYRRSFTVPESMKGKRIKLYFKGVLVYAEVFVNDKSIGRHYSGVTPFSLDITHVVRFDRTNWLRVYVVNQDIHYITPPVSRYEFTSRAPIYYSYYRNNAGIWQDVLLVAEPYITIGDVQIITSVRNRKIDANITIVNFQQEPVELVAFTSVIDKAGNLVLTFSEQKVNIPPTGEILLNFSKRWEKPKLWSPEDPNLYYLHTKLISEGKLIDEYFQRFGFREFWIQGKDFYLNGNRISLHGSWSGEVGFWRDAFIRPEYLRLYLMTLKEANYLGPRMHIEIPYIIDICDEIGLPVIATVISDGPRFFDPGYVEEGMQHALQDIRDLLRLNRNHPSILIWSTENEDRAPQDNDIYERYVEIDRVFMKMDPTRPFMHDGSPGFDYPPIENRHYDNRLSSLERQIHMLDGWRQSGNKPRIEGEIHPIANEFFWGGLFRYIGDRVWGDVDYRYKQWDRIIRLLGGGWRASGSSGFMLHGAINNMLISPIYTSLLSDGDRAERRVIKFLWNDLSTPFPKPEYLVAAPLDFFNPWLNTLPRVIRTPVFYSIRHVFNPILVTLAYATEHTYWNDQRIVKEVYIINEGPQNLSNVSLRWSLYTKEGDKITSGKIQSSFRQGERRSVPVSFSLQPFLFNKTTILKFQVELVTEEGKVLSDDFMEITVYPRPAKLKWQSIPIFLYDKTGRTEKFLNQQDIPYKKITPKDLSTLPEKGFLLIGYNAVDASLISNKQLLTDFVSEGGKVLIMEQKMKKRLSRSIAFIRAPRHPVFRGLPAERIEFWRSRLGEISSANLRINRVSRQVALVEVVDNSEDNVFSDYVPVLVESKLGMGEVIFCNLNLTDSLEQGEPEAMIMFKNLLIYASSRADIKKPNVYFAGDKSTRKFLTNKLLIDNLMSVSPTDLTKGLQSNDLLILGNGITDYILKKQKYLLEEFVKKGGIVFCIGGWREGVVSWTPVSLTIRRLPQKITNAQNYSTGVFHLWKRTDNRIVDGLGDLYIFTSRRARYYYIGDPIPGLNYGFVRPQSPWIVGYEIAVRETAGYMGKHRLTHYDSQGDAALIILEYGKGKYILSTVPINNTDISKRLYGTLMANLNVSVTHSQPFLAFLDIETK